MHSYLHILTTTDHIAEPVPPMFADLVFLQKKLCFFYVYILKRLEEMFICVCFL